jgi:hypothetical protein
MFQVYGIGQALIPVLPPPLHFANTPNSNQTNYEIGQIVYTGVVGSYTFYIYAGAGVWELLDISTGSLDTLTTDDSTVVVPTAGNINLKGSGSTTTSGSGSNATVALTGLTNHAVLVGAGTTTITKLAVGTTGQVLTGASAADPAFAALGTNSGLTAHGVLLGEGNSAIAATAAGTTGQVLIGSTGADPAFGALGVNSNLTGLIVGNTNSAFTTATYTPAASWTPAFSLATPGDSAWTYSTQFGRYNQVGAVVHFSASITWSAFTNSTGSGVWRVSLPVAAGAFTLPGQIQINGSGIDASAETANLPANFYGKIASAASVCTLSVQEGGTGNAAAASFDLTVTQVKTSGTLTISGFYFAA